eukprot:GHVS01027951.1.p3 GENE.GHVS01027951.1~~GHVS01027951.1.p3  ORF type:complete len:157 (-),score=18.30 GHVS01027951.1:936-1406(-)
MVGLLSEHLFGYAVGPGNRERNARAVGLSMLCFTVIPWLLTVCLYCALHVTYQKDRKEAIGSKGEEVQTDEPEDQLTDVSPDGFKCYRTTTDEMDDFERWLDSPGLGSRSDERSYWSTGEEEEDPATEGTEAAESVTSIEDDSLFSNNETSNGCRN